MSSGSTRQQLARREFLKVLGGGAFALLTADILTGCGGGGGGSSSGTQNRGVLKPNVFLLPSDGSVQITSQTNTTLTLTGNAAAYQPGAVIVSGAGEGLLRKVVSVANNGSSTVLTTQQASLDDVFLEAHIHEERTLTLADFTSIQSLHPGVTIGGQRSPSSRDTGAKIPINFAGAKFDALEVNGAGSLQFDWGWDFEKNDDELLYVRLFPRLTIEGNLGFSIKGSVAAGTKVVKVPVGEIKGQWGTLIPTPFGVFIPVIVTWKGGVNFVAQFAFEAGLGTSWKGKVTVGWGGEWRKESGFKTLSILDHELSGTGKKVFGKGTLSVSPWQEEIEARIYGILGPHITFDTPAGELALERTNSSFGGPDGKTTLTADAVYRATGEIGLKAFSDKLNFNFLSVPFEQRFRYLEIEWPDQGQVNTEIQ